jgi:serine/threonine protein kinase
LGAYEITAPIGTGGMGEIYKARDKRLARDVAVKILPPEVAGDASRRQRFEQEARAVAALNHPNIVAVYDVGAEDGLSYMVMELVNGEPLRGAKLALRTTLDIAVQITSGLAAAHAARISHRDLKPDNILLTREGRVKILDFGLAKITGPSAPTDSTQSMAVRTEPGVVLGTVGYMSPEQVRGLAADHRSDIFSFGVILYELLSGTRAFHRETKVETMTAILKHDPPELPDSVPGQVRRMVAHCLEKDPANRFQSARDLSFALSLMSQGGTSYSATAPFIPQRSLWRRRGALVLVGLIFLALGTLAGRLLWNTPESPPWTGGILGGPEIALEPRLSPDGQLLAFQAMDRGLTQVALMKPESGNWSILTHNRERGVTIGIAWSVDGALIYYDRLTDVPQGIYSVPVLGGEERLVLQNAASPEVLPDGTLLLSMLNEQRKSQLFRFWPETGRLQSLPIMNSGFPTSTEVRAFPDGKEAAVLGAPLGEEAQGWRLLAVDLATGASRPLTPAWERDFLPYTLAVAPDGKSILAGMPAGSLTRIVSIPRSGRSSAQTLFTVASQVWSLDAGRDGSVYASVVDRPAELTRFSPAGEHGEKIGSFPMLNYKETRSAIGILPDGRLVIPASVSGHARLMAIEKGKDPVRLINTTEETSAPLAAAGPREIAFVIGPKPRQTIAIAETATGRITRRISLGKGEILSLASSPDGRTLYYAAAGSIWSIPSSGGKSKMIRTGESATMDPSGRSLVVSVTENSKVRLFRVLLGSGLEHEIVPDGSAPLTDVPLSPAALNMDGRLLLPLSSRDSWFYAPGGLDTATGHVTRLPSDGVSDYDSMAWTPDGQIVALHVGLRSTLWRFQPTSELPGR